MCVTKVVAPTRVLDALAEPDMTVAKDVVGAPALSVVVAISPDGGCRFSLSEIAVVCVEHSLWLGARSIKPQ